MKCAYCNFQETKVVETRESAGDVTRRRRECLKCSKRFTTYERIETTPLAVIKKSGEKEKFDRQKIIAGVRKASEKTSVTEETIQQIADDIEQNLRMQDSPEIKSSYIGQLVMRHLKKLDKVAYLRFASVYKKFDNVKMFQEEAKKLG